MTVSLREKNFRERKKKEEAAGQRERERIGNSFFNVRRERS